MSIRASQHGDNARRRISTPFLAFLRNRESRTRFLFACAQAAAPIALVLGLVIAGSELRETAVPTTIAASVPGAVP